MLAVLPLSSHRKSSPDSNLMICFYKIFYSPCSALRKTGPLLAVYLSGSIKYIDHASNCDHSVRRYSTNLGSQFTGSAQTSYCVDEGESLAVLCVCGRPVHVSSVRNREKRLPECRFQICAILKRQNSIRARHAPISMFALQINSTMQKFRRRGFIQEWKNQRISYKSDLV